MVERLRRLLPALWAGALLCVALIATPAPFAILDSPVAGRVVSRIFMQEAWLSLVLASLLSVLLLSAERARRYPGEGRRSLPNTELLLTLGVVMCTAAGYFAVQPLLPAAKAGQGVLSFGQLHAASAAFFGLKTVMVLVLAWRGAAPVPRWASA